MYVCVCVCVCVCVWVGYCSYYFLLQFLCSVAYLLRLDFSSSLFFWLIIFFSYLQCLHSYAFLFVFHYAACHLLLVISCFNMLCPCSVVGSFTNMGLLFCLPTLLPVLCCLLLLFTHVADSCWCFITICLPFQVLCCLPSFVFVQCALLFVYGLFYRANAAYCSTHTSQN